MPKKPRVDYPAIYFKNNKDTILINAPLINCFKKDYKFAKIMRNDDNKTIKITFKTNYEPGYIKLRIYGKNNSSVWIGNKNVNDKNNPYFSLSAQEQNMITDLYIGVFEL